MAPSTKPTAKRKSTKATATSKKSSKPKSTSKSSRSKATSKAAKPPKVKIAVVRSLATCLERDGATQQLAALARALPGDATPAPAAAAAAAVLAHTRKGTPIARGYLQALVDAAAGATTSTGADAFLAHAAGMERGRRATRDAFLAVWRLGSDRAIVEQAVRNYLQTELDDPEVLEAGVETARALANAGVLAEREARLAVATRLRPLVADLRSSGPRQQRARTQLSSLSPADLAHVHRRVVSDVGSFDETLAVAAMAAAVDDDATSRLALFAALIDMRYHGADELAAIWKARVAGGDAGLISRLVALFELGCIWATDDDHLEILIHALYPASSRPEVFAAALAALGHANEVAREAVCEEWLRESEGAREFDDAQSDALIRAATAIAIEGDQTAAQRAANRALFYCAHAGAFQALVDGFGVTTRNKKLRWSLYFGLSHLDHAGVVPFCVERLFVEEEEMWALLEVFEAKLSASTHREVVAALELRRAEPGVMRAAALYAEVLINKKPSPRLLLDLTRAVVAWPDPSDPLERRRLRYVLDQATNAALAARRTVDARAFLERARAIAAPAYSDYQEVDRERKTATALTTAEGKQALAHLESGALDREAEQVRAKAVAARAAGVPVRADDAHLAALGACTVAARLLSDRASHETWFFDEDGTLHVYDGYEVVAPPCTVGGARGTRIRPEVLRSLLVDRGRSGERVTCMAVGKKQGGRVREALRLGALILIWDGASADHWGHVNVTPIALAFPDEAAARRVFAMVVANPPEGTASIDRWYVAGHGAIARAYYVPTASGGYNRNGDVRLTILGAEITGSVDSDVPPAPLGRHADHATAVAAYEAWEHALFADRGGQLTKMWIDRDATRREDTLLAAYLDDRYRDDDKDASWHLRGLEEMWGEIVAAGLAEQAPNVRVELGPPATDAELAAYQALVPEPLPVGLVAAWREVGGAGFTTPRIRVRFLSPREVVARRDELRGALRTHAETRLKGKARAARIESLTTLDVLATVDDQPAIVFDLTQSRPDRRCFASVDSDWWESSLAWQLATDVTIELRRDLETIGDVHRLRLGQRPGPATLRVQLTKGTKFWEAIVDDVGLMTRSGTTGEAGKASVKQLATADAARAAHDKAVKAQRAKGYR